MNAKRFDFHAVMRRISTWLSIVGVSAITGLGTYAAMPARVQAAFPDWALIVLGTLALGSHMLVPFATSFKQKNIDA
ncbi:hypothetical protein [Marilutibacter alkalisoli]|uniref:Uncharacterized protein n=1 Tax=Marilutibacter alkalisoli TaxID=2591633 RepID=A0A514BTW3_9GAMM|nr:hypothetical protein [Lysobacter alkalisoli]QDH70851.1 hypothetical protein FKV23_12730 [Lysobacter alkalisoli]